VEDARSEVRQAATAGVLLVSAGIMTGVLNLLFNVVVARGGGVSAFGTIGPLLMVGTVAGILATGLQYGVARAAVLAPKPTAELARQAFLSVLPWVCATFGLAALALPIAGFLDLSSPLPVLIVTLLAMVTVTSAAVTGLLIGLRRFRIMAALAVGAAALRFGLGFLVGHGVAAVNGSVLASVLPAFGSLLLGLAVLLHVSRPSVSVDVEATVPKPDERQHTGATGAVMAGALWAVWGLPLLFSRHALSPMAAGDFAAAQLLAGGIIWATAPLVTAFYPTIVRRRHHSPVLVGVLGTFGIALAGLIVLTAGGPVLIAKLYGGHFSGSRALFLVLALSATTTATATFGCWAALAWRGSVRLPLAGVGVALALELLWDGLVGHTALILAAGPLMSLTLSGGVISASSLVGRRGAHASPPGGAEPAPVRPISRSPRSE
jgi:hypothetical protein